MIRCTACGSKEWKQTVRCIVDPANDKFLCRTCGHKFKRYDPPKGKPDGPETPVLDQQPPPGGAGD